MIFFAKEDLLKTEKEAQDKPTPLTPKQEAIAEETMSFLKSLSSEEMIDLMNRDEDYSEK